MGFFYYNYEMCIKTGQKFTRDDKKELLSSLPETGDENELRIKESVSNAN